MTPARLAIALLLACTTGKTGAHRAQDLLPEPVAAAAVPVPAPEPRAWNTSRVAGPGFRNRPHEVARVKLAGPVEELLTDGTRILALAGGQVQMVRSDKVVWTQPLNARALALLPDGAWLSREEETVRLDIGTGAIGERAVAGGEAGSAVQPLGEAARAWQTRDGTLRTSAGWFLQLGGLTSAGAGIATDGGTIYAVSLDAVVLAADENGERWRVSLPAAPVGAPLLGVGSVVVAVAASNGQSGGVVALDRDGKPLWRARAPSPALAPALGPDGDGGWTVYLANRTGELLAFDALSGRSRWTVSFAGAITAMLVQDDVVLVASADGSLNAVEAWDGGVRWDMDVGAITAAPVILGDRLWVGLADGSLVGLGE